MYNVDSTLPCLWPIAPSGRDDLARLSANLYIGLSCADECTFVQADRTLVVDATKLNLILHNHGFDSITVKLPF